MLRIFLLATVLFNALPALAMDQTKILHALQAVVMVRGYNETGGLSYGSGVVVAKNKVISNCHVFRSTKDPWIARGEDAYTITGVQADRWHDLCLLTTTELPFSPAVIGSANNAKRGQSVLAIGHSNGVPAPLTSIGNIKSTYKFDDGKVIRSDAKFRMGASGSGIFDMEGQLLGVNTFKTPGRQAYFYSLPIEWLSELEKLPIETKFPITGKAFWEEDDDKKPFFMQIAIPKLSEDWAKLLQVAQNWIQSDPKNTDAWYELGNAEENLQHIQNAQKAYQQAVALDETNTDALFRLGVLAQSSGDKATVHNISLAISNINKELAKEYSLTLGCGQEC